MTLCNPKEQNKTIEIGAMHSFEGCYTNFTDNRWRLSGKIYIKTDETISPFSMFYKKFLKTTSATFVVMGTMYYVYCLMRIVYLCIEYLPYKFYRFYDFLSIVLEI